MIRPFIGLALAPTAISFLAVAASTMGGLAQGSRAAAPMIAGAAACLLARLFADMESSLGLAMRRLYVLGHELSHAAAAWAWGAKVYRMKVEATGGHVDLSHSNAVIALAPYALPLYAVAVTLAYRIIVWQKPTWSCPSFFLGVLGAALAFHLIFTFDSLWSVRQPDLKAAGGAVFSLPIIALANALTVLLLLKLLFPGEVLLSHALARAGLMSMGFWRGAGRLALAAVGQAY